MKGKRAARVLPSIVACLPVLFGVESANAEVRFGGDATGHLIYDLEEYADLATRPGTALAVLDDWDWGITFGEKLVGQVTTFDGDFDVISGAPWVPLAIDSEVDAEDAFLILSVSSSTVGIGLGAIGFPMGAAIGEGALTVLYDVDQRVIAFDVIGPNGGALRLQFFDRLGQAIGDIVVEGLVNTAYAFSSDEWEIAAVTLTNTDLSGVGFDNFRYDPHDARRTGPPKCSLPGSYDLEHEGDVTVLALESGVSEDPDGTWLDYSWSTNCPGGYFDNHFAPDPILVVDTANTCQLECTVTLVVDYGYESDICTTTVNVDGGVPATVTCPPDLTVEADGFWNVEELDEWLESAVAERGELFNDFDSLTPACGQTGSATVTWTVEPVGACGGPVSCSATFTIVDTTPPTLHLETETLVVDDLGCDDEEFVTLPLVTATDVGEWEVDVTHDAPEVFPVGQTTIVTFSATDDCGNTATGTVDVTVLYGSGIEVEVSQRTITTGKQPRNVDRGLMQEPLADVVVALYESSPGSCAHQQIRDNLSTKWRVPQAVATLCEPVNTGVTDEAGMAFVDVPPGSYMVVAHIDTDGDGMPDEYVGQSVSSIYCGHWKSRNLVFRVD